MNTRTAATANPAHAALIAARSDSILNAAMSGAGERHLTTMERAPLTPAGIHRGLDAFAALIATVDAAAAITAHRQTVESDRDGNARWLCSCGDRGLWTQTSDPRRDGAGHARSHA